MITVYKNDLSRNVKEEDLSKYLSAGWAEKAQSASKGKKVLVEEVTVLTPAIDANPIVISNIGDANDKEN